jgi:hypothetical protein
MRSIWLDRVLARDPLPVVQMGFEIYSSCQRSVTVSQATVEFCRTLKRQAASAANVFIPQVRMLPHKVRHDLDALRVVQNH